MRRKKRKWRRGDEERVGGGWENELGFRLAFRVLYLVIIIIIKNKKKEEGGRFLGGVLYKLIIIIIILSTGGYIN